MQKPHTSASLYLQVYSLIFTIVMCVACVGGMATSADMFISKEAIESKRTLFHVTMAILIVSIGKAIFGYVFQYCSKQRLMAMIEEAFDLSQLICDFCDDTLATRGISVKSMPLFKAKLTATFVQIAIILSTGYILQRDSFSFRMQLIIFSHYVGALLSSMYFCGMFVVLQFYLTLNNKLHSCITSIEHVKNSKAHQIRMQQFCDLSDDIDRLANLYERCLVFTERMNGYFTVSVYFALAHAFASVLTELYFIYQMLAKIAMAQPVHWIIPIRDFGFLGIYVIEICFMVCVSNAVIDEGRSTGGILFSTVKGIDERLNRSVSVILISKNNLIVQLIKAA